ncbi:MAG: hypothetical protein MRZ59_01990 [Clostridiales bacterium]|nr:hypothetical protein [Clostridiales bacterium]MDY3745531.1 hypothetical protein [Lachnospiraceae bacterium]
MDLNKVIKELKRGYNIEKNLSVYGNALAKSYCNQAMYMLAMNLVSNYDLIEENDCHDAENVRKMFDEVVHVIENVVVDGDFSALGTNISKVTAIRDEIIKKTDAIDEYTYVLQVYEHLLNRAEYRFKDMPETEDIQEFKDQVMIYISGSNQPELINERIKSVMGELPVRLTMTKFLDMINTGSQCYKGVRNDIAEEFFEHLNACARPISPKRLDKDCDVLYKVCEKMLSLDIENLTESEYKEAADELIEAGKYIADNLTAYLRLIEIVNDLLIVMMTVPYVMHFSDDMKKAVAVIKEQISAERKGTFLRPDEDIVGLLSYLTDRQPVYQGEHMMLEDALYVILNDHKKDIDALMFGDLYHVLHTCLQLSSVSVLTKLKDEEAYFTVDQIWLNQMTAKTDRHFEEVLAPMTRPFKRAVIALTFSCMPVIFDRLDDMGEYIVRSIEGCRDLSERAASIDIIKNMMAQS